MTKKCDHRSVGALIVGSGGDYAGEPGHYLISPRAKPPVGQAPVAGHLDGLSFIDALHNEVREEVGLEVVDYKFINAPWRDNACRREPKSPAHVVGHQWEFYLVHARGTVTASPDEHFAPRWVNAEELQHLAVWTAMHAIGRVTPEEFKADPGLEPVWVQPLVDAGIIRMSKLDLEAIDRLTHATPA